MTDVTTFRTRHRYVRLTQAELNEEARLRFGGDPLTYAFECPRCGDTATVGEWQALGNPTYAGQGCVGRASGRARAAAGWAGRGCDWAAHGLFRGPWEIVMPADGDLPERSAWAFSLAGDPAPGGPVARELAAACR